jgi:tryptophan synthase beta chain
MNARPDARATAPGDDPAAGDFPDACGRYGPYGGRYVPETLVAPLLRLEATARIALADPGFLAAFRAELATWAGRPTALTRAAGLGSRWGVEVWLKREDLAHTGAHKINNAVGQVLLAKRLGARRVIAETGAGQHGVATAAACARLGMPCSIYMGSVDMERQAPNVGRMRLFGAEVVAVDSGDRTLRAAVDEALRDWVADPDGTYYCLGSAIGPHPYPAIVRALQSVIGDEAREQLLAVAGRLPDAAAACVGGGSNAIGLFAGFVDDPDVRLIGVEAAGAASLGTGRAGVLHGARSSLLADDDGQIADAHSISAGLDYPGVGPEHAFLRDSGRAEYVPATDEEALTVFHLLAEREGIIPALEPAHALARALELDAELVLVGLSGRGDKDLATVLSR